ncbi:MAG: acetoacetate--CoA ligase, partial [Acetobacteraceae bacterium]|nr:acetoacetate--CoA ligase [Acetobacteraceae bacterium]
VHDFRLFWRAFLNWSHPILDGAAEPVCIGDTVEHAVFFPNLSLNYAENLLAGDDERVAVIACQPGRTVQISRQNLRERVRRAATGLAGLGVGAGDRVVAIAYNDADTVVACLATAALGASFSTAAPDMAAPAILSRFTQLSPAVLMAHTEQRPGSQLRRTLEDVIADLPSLRAIVCLGDADILPHPSVPVHRLSDLIGQSPPLVAWRKFPFNHPLFILFSSGTTGVPKCIMHGAGGTLLEHLKELRLHCDLRPGERLFFQTSCAWMMWNWQLSALACRATIVLNDRPMDNPGALWSIVAEHDVDVFGTSPAYLKLCETAGYLPINQHVFTRLRAILSTGSILYDSQFDWVVQNVKRVPLQSISGGTDIIGCFVLGNPDLPVHRGEAQCRSLALDVDAVGPDGAAVPPGEVGELVCRKPFPSRPLGFFGDPDGTRFQDAYFTQNPGLWTHGDRVSFTTYGTARMHGRSDGVLNVRGIRIGTAEIYAALQDMPELADAMAVEQEMPDNPAGGRIVLLVVLKPGITLTSDLAIRLRQQIARRTAAVFVPGAIADVPDLPTTHSGKRSETAARDAINHRPIRNADALRNRECLEAIATHPALRMDATPVLATDGSQSTEDKLKIIWASAFGVDRIDADDDFFALGGDSLLAVSICTCIEDVFGCSLPIAALFQTPTVGALARLLDSGLGWQGASPLVPLRAGIGQPMFLLHSISGNVFEWHDLLARLEINRPILAVQARGLDPNCTPATSVEAMAADYVALIRERQPHGPYALMGYSFGGLLTYEIAVRLSRAGEAIEFVGLIDTYVQDDALPLLPWLRFRLDRLSHFQHRSEALGVMGVFRRVRAKMLRQLQHNAILRFEPDTGAQTNLPPVLRQVRSACEQAFKDYRPPRHRLNITFFRSPGRLPYFCDPLIVWQRKAASVTIIDVPGGHGMMMLEPNVAVLAAEIARCLAPGTKPALAPADSVSTPEAGRALDGTSDGKVVAVRQPSKPGSWWWVRPTGNAGG